MPSFHAPGTRKGNRHWTARGRINGQLYEPSFPKAKNKSDARRYWKRFEAAIIGADAAGAGEEPVSGAGETAEKLTFSHAAAEYYLTSKPQGTQLAALERIEAMFETHEELRNLGLDEIGNVAVHICADALYPEASGAHKNRMVVTPVRAVLNAYELEHERDERPYRAPRIKAYNQTKPASRPAGDGVLDKLIAAVGDDHEKRTFLKMLYHQGFRHSETLLIRWTEEGKAPFIDLSAQAYWFYSPKADRWKFVPMSAALFEELANWPAEDRKGRLFKRWANRSSTRKWLKPLCDRLKIRFTPHMARHRYAKDRDADGATRDQIAASSTWFGVRSLDHYIEVDEESARQVVNRGHKLQEVGNGSGESRRRRKSD